MEFYSTQVHKLVSNGKAGTTVFGFEHTFPRFYDKTYLEDGKSLEPSGLERFVVQCNQKTEKGTVSTKANLPIKEISRIREISRELLLKETFAPEEKDVVIYAPPAKYMRGFDNEKGHSLCYQIRISYQAKLRSKIKIEVKNFYAPVQKQPNGTTQIVGNQINGEKSVSIFTTTEEWFDVINHLEELKNSYAAAAFEANLQKSFIPKSKK